MALVCSQVIVLFPRLVGVLHGQPSLTFPPFGASLTPHDASIAFLCYFKSGSADVQASFVFACASRPWLIL